MTAQTGEIDTAACLAAQDLPAWLTCLPEKRDCFARDPAFCRGWRTVLELEQEGRLRRSRLWNLGSVLFKSDSLIRGNTDRGLQALAGAGFQVRAGRSVQFSPGLVRQFWRYALGRYSDQRVMLLSRLLAQAPSLYLLVQAERPAPDCPTALRLTDFKGEAVPGLRSEDQLRALLGAPQTAMFNYVHTADEPADLVRELGLLFSAPARRVLLLDAMAGRAQEAISLAGQMLAAAPHSDLAFSTALAKLRAALAAAMPNELASAEGWLARLAQGEPQAWPALRDLSAARGLDLAPLDRLILDCQFVVLKRSRISQPFPSCAMRHWRASGIGAPAGALADGGAA